MKKVRIKPPDHFYKPATNTVIIYDNSEEDEYEKNQQYQNGDDAGNPETVTSSS